MKFFPYELIAVANGWKNDSPAKMSNAARLLEAQGKKYDRHLDRIRRRLGESAWQFFRNGKQDESLHDGQLLRLQIGDGLDFEPEVDPFPLNQARNRFRIEFLSYKGTYHYVFDCAGIHSVRCELFPSKARSADALGDLYIYEIHSVNPTLLALGFLFATGASINVEFRKLVFKRKVLKNAAGSNKRRNTALQTDERRAVAEPELKCVSGAARG